MECTLLIKFLLNIFLFLFLYSKFGHNLWNDLIIKQPKHHIKILFSYLKISYTTNRNTEFPHYFMVHVLQIHYIMASTSHIIFVSSTKSLLFKCNNPVNIVYII